MLSSRWEISVLKKRPWTVAWRWKAGLGIIKPWYLRVGRHRPKSSCPALMLNSLLSSTWPSMSIYSEPNKVLGTARLKPCPLFPFSKIEVRHRKRSLWYVGGVVQWRKSQGEVGPQTTWLGHPLMLNQASCAWWLQFSCLTTVHLGSPSPPCVAMGWLFQSPSLGSWAGAAEAHGREPALPFWVSTHQPMESSGSYFILLIILSQRLHDLADSAERWWERSRFWSQLWIQTLLLLCPRGGILQDCLTPPSLSFRICKMVILILAF